MNKKIHAIWLGGSMNAMTFACIDDWDKQGYQYKLWTELDPEIMQWIEGCRFAKECYQRGLYAFVTDYLRLKVLKQDGGLYLDTDVTIQKDFSSLFEDIQFSVGYESINELGTAIIYAKNSSKILDRLIRFYEEDIYDSPLFMGPSIMTHFVISENIQAQENCKLYPLEYFYNYQGESKSFVKSSNSYLIHWFQHSWKNPQKTQYLRSKHMGLLGKLYVWQKYFFRLN